MGKHRKNWTIEQLKDERIRLLAMFVGAKTNYMKNFLHYKIKSVNKELYTITKETKYL
jgi:hypothetical protein